MNRHLSYLLVAILLAPVPLRGQWAVKPRVISEQSPDDHISLQVRLPVLVGEVAPEARKTINHALGQLSDVDGLVRGAKQMIREHTQFLAKRARREAQEKRRGKTGKTDKSSEEDESGDLGEDYPDEHSLDYQVGLNDGRIFSLSFQGYWHGGGGAVGNPYAIGCIFCASTGRKLEPAELFGADWDSRIKREAKVFLQAEAEELFEDWEARLPAAEMQLFLPNAKTLAVCFAKYSIAPGVAGVVRVEIPLARLSSAVPAPSPLTYLLK